MSFILDGTIGKLTPTATFKEGVKTAPPLFIGPVKVVSAPYITDGAWKVVRGFNLATEFQRIYNRLPVAGDDIIIDIPSDWAFVGSDTSRAGITIDNRCNLCNTITIYNAGMVLGIGGTAKGYHNDGGGAIPTPPIEPGNGIDNTSTIIPYFRNMGKLCGGGGYGAGGRWRDDSHYAGWGAFGGGGAPYGKGGVFTVSGVVRLYSGEIGSTDATLTVPGNGAAQYGVTGGVGGNFGLRGGTHSWGDLGGLPGKVSTGNINIVNIDSGVTIGG